MALNAAALKACRFDALDLSPENVAMAQVQVMQATAKEMKKQFKTKELDINAIDKMTDEMARWLACVLSAQLFSTCSHWSGQLHLR